MIIRKLTPEDSLQFTLTHSLGWEARFNAEDIEDLPRLRNNGKPMTAVSDSTIWGAFTPEGVLSTSFSEIRHEIRLDGGWYRSCAIGGVVTRPDMRRMGAVRECLDAMFRHMHEDGLPFTTLLPFDVPFYRKFGYEGIYRICNITMPVRALSKYRCDVTRISELGGEKTLPELNGFYDGFVSDMNMALKRDAKLWKGIVNVEPRTFGKFSYICRGTDGRISGYMSFMQDRSDGVKTMKVTEFVYGDLDALCQLLGFIYTFVAHYERVVFFELPLSLDFYLLLDDYNATTYDQKICNMLRIGDAQTALEAKRYPMREGSFSIKVTDSLEWNCGVYDVSFGGGETRVVKRASGDYDIAVDERALARLVFGEEPLFSDVMRYVPGIEVVSNRDTLRDVFVKRPLFHTDFY